MSQKSRKGVSLIDIARSQASRPSTNFSFAQTSRIDPEQADGCGRGKRVRKESGRVVEAREHGQFVSLILF